METVEFLGRPTFRANLISKLAEGSYFMIGFFLFFVLSFTLLYPVSAIFEGSSFFEIIITLCIGNIFLLIAFASVIPFLGIPVLIGSLFVKDSNWDKDRDLVIRIDDRYLTIDQEFISFFDIRRVNRIPLSLIDRVSRDVEPYLREKGIRIPWWYKPFCQSAPSERMYPSLLYANMGRANMPFDHLVRIDLIAPYPIIAIKRQHPDYPKYENLLKTVIVTIRPEDQDRFMTEIMKRIDPAKKKGSVGKVKGPPI